MGQCHGIRSNHISPLPSVRRHKFSRLFAGQSRNQWSLVGKGKNSSFLRNVHKVSGAKVASYSLDSGVHWWGKAAEP